MSQSLYAAQAEACGRIYFGNRVKLTAAILTGIDSR